MGPAGGGPPSSWPPPVSSTKQQQHSVRSDLAAPRPATNWEGPPHPKLPTPVARTSQRLCQFRGLWLGHQYLTPEFGRGPFVPWPSNMLVRGHGSRSHSPVETRERAQTDGLQSLDTTDRKLGGADSRSTQQQAQPWNRKPIPGNEIFFIQSRPLPLQTKVQCLPTLALILLLQQQLVHSSLQDDKVCCVARNALQQSWGQRLQVESRLVGL